MSQGELEICFFCVKITRVCFLCIKVKEFALSMSRSLEFAFSFRERFRFWFNMWSNILQASRFKVIKLHLNKHLPHFVELFEKCIFFFTLVP